MADPIDPDFAHLLARIAQALTRAGLPFMVIGGQAVLMHGEPRLTQDVDITLYGDPTQLGDVLAAAREAGLTPLPSDTRQFVLETFVLPLASSDGLRVDLIFSNTAFERAAIERAEAVDVAGTPVPFASAEDLILHKLFAGRPRDAEDARGIVRRKGASLDWDYIRRWAELFADVPGREQLVDDVDRLQGQV